MWHDFNSAKIVVFALVAASMLLYSSFLILRFYALGCYKRAQPFRKRTLLALLAACLILAGLIARCYGRGVATIVFFCWIFPLLLPKIDWCLWIAHALCWSLGLLICNIIWHIMDRTVLFFYNFCEASVPLPSYYASIFEVLQVKGSGWPWFLALGLLLLLSAYLLCARIWSRAAGISCRQIFGCAVLTLWFLFAVNYLGQLFLAYRGVKEAKQALAKLEQRFDRPLTAQTLGELYYNGEEADRDFWEKEITLCEESYPFTDKFSELLRIPDIMPQEAIQQWRQHLASKDEALSQWEQMFAGDIPPFEYSFQAGSLLGMLLPHLSNFRGFNRLSLWRTHLALADGDVTAAFAVNQRQFKANSFLLREPHLISSLVWMACSDFWLLSCEKLLASKLLSDEQLLLMGANLKTLEKQVPLLHQRVFYCEAVCGLDLFVTMNRGGASNEKSRGFRWRSFRYFAPQLRWYAALDKARLAQSYLVADFSEIPEDPMKADRRPLLISSMMSPPLNKFGKRFYEQTAKLRATQALIMAEQYRRKQGNWPVQLENLPEDPFNGEPLRYYHGDCPVEFTVAVWNEEIHRWELEKQQGNLSVVQVRSVGPDKIDDGCGQNSINSGERRSDDIRATLRLNTE